MRSSRTGVAAVLVAALAAGAEGQDNVDALNARTLALYQQGRFADALPVAEEALRLAERADGANGESGRVALNNLAVIYENVERFADAERTYARALAVAERSGKSSIAVAQCLTNLGLFHKRLGRYDRAEPHYLRAIAIYEERLGRDHPDTARAANNLGELYRALGQVEQAEAFLRRGLEARLEAYGERHPEVAQSLNNLGLLAYEAGALDVAGELLAAALEIRVETLGADHPLTGQSLSNLLLVRLASRDPDGAEPLAERSLEVRTRALGKDHVETAISLFHLASVRRLQGRLREAEGPMRESVAILSRTLGPDDPRTILVTDGLGTLLAATGSWDEAIDTVDAARRGARRHVARVLPALAAAEQAQFLRTRDAGELQAALTLGLLRKANARSAERSAGWLANGKAVAQEASAQQIILARQTGNRETAEAVVALDGVRGELAQLSQRTPAPDRAAAWRAAIGKLQAEERRLVHRIGGQLATLDRDEPWVEIDAIRRGIPAAAMLVDIARFDVYDFQARGKDDAWRPARYAAWLVPPAGAGNVTILDLGPAIEIDAAVTAYRQVIETVRKEGFTRGQAKAEEDLAVAAAPLATRVLQPIVAALGDATELILSPDGDLWLVPWQALPLADGRYALERFTVRTVTSARDLVPVRVEGDDRRGRSVVVADPAFDAAPAGGAAGPVADGSRSFAPSKDLTRTFERLVNTRAEALASKAALALLGGGEPQLLLGPEASETRLRQAVARPRTVVLATHGFFLADQRIEPEDGLRSALSAGAGGGAGRASNTAGGPLEDPLLRCGLALAGANVGARARDGDDGILTGAEIVGLDLLGTDLVVLSACETGVGSVHVGEGVAGLRQAFQIAGARSVVATLWQVPDAESARIMAGFYANLARGLPAARALREAQLAFVRERRGDRNYEAAHPYLWAAYGVTGN